MENGPQNARIGEDEECTCPIELLLELSLPVLAASGEEKMPSLIVEILYAVQPGRNPTPEFGFVVDAQDVARLEDASDFPLDAIERVVTRVRAQALAEKNDAGDPRA